MNRGRYYLVRTVQTVFIFLLIASFIFLLFRLMPGDIATLMLEQGADPETVKKFEKKWGLGQPLYVQYLKFMRNLLTLNPGNSMQFGTPVVDYVQVKIFNSAILVGPAITAGYLVGSLTGTVFGSMDRPRLERVGVTIAIFLGTIPIFFLSIIVVIFFANHLGWFPSSGLISTEVANRFTNAPWWRPYLSKSFILHYTLPFFVIMARYGYLPMLLMRTSVNEVMGQGFSYYHRVTGLPKWRKLAHLSRHASLPVITFYPLSMTRAIGGLVLVEIVFNWPGMGFALVEAVFFRDYPVVQFVFILIAAFILIANFLIDIAYGAIDPRVSVGSE